MATSSSTTSTSWLCSLTFLSVPPYWRSKNGSGFRSNKVIMNKAITVYGTDWCGDSRRTRRHLEQRGLKYDYVDIDADEQAEKKVIEFNKGKRRIPLVEIASETGTRALSVPSERELEEALKGDRG